MNSFATEWLSFLAFVGGLVLFACSILTVYKATSNVLSTTLLQSRRRLAEKVALWLAGLWMLVGLCVVSVLAIMFG